MNSLFVILFTLVYITVLVFSRKVPFFIVLFSGAVLSGLLAGFEFETVLSWTLEGMGGVFSSIAVIILSGVVIVRVLSDQGQLDIIISGIRGFIKNPEFNAGIVGYILAVPTTCCITTYMMVAPAFKQPSDKNSASNRFLYLVAVGSIISYVLIFPTPVTIPLLTGLAPEYPAFDFDLISIPLSLLILVLILLLSGAYYKRNYGRGFCEENSFETGKEENQKKEYPLNIRLKAWAPFIAMIIAIPVGLLIFNLPHTTLVQCIMLSGMFTALALAPSDVRFRSFSKGAQFAGFILFDFCSAGAVGNVIVESGAAGGVVNSMIPVLPDIVLPFLIAALFATVQGSRVVTAVISSQIIASTGLIHTIHPIPLILMISAGTCFISYLTDPYFWLVQRTTGDDIRTVLKNYTLPLALVGAVIFSAAVLLSVFIFPAL